MRLIIIRHGETEENKNRIVQGHLPGKLSKLGIEQAKKIAERLKDEKIDKIFSSDLARASDTAKEIAKFHLKIPLKFVEELRERYLGILQGEKAPIEWRPKKWDSEFAKKLQAETPENLFGRAEKFIESIHKEHKGKTILLVAHNGINQALITYLLGKSWENIKELEFLKNTAVTIFEVSKNKRFKIVLMNCTKHLK